MKNSSIINYADNGRSNHSHLVKTTIIKSPTKEYVANNGRLFNEEFSKNLLSKNKTKYENKFGV